MARPAKESPVIANKSIQARQDFQQETRTLIELPKIDRNPGESVNLGSSN
jgi:hypothetical protein